MELNACFDPLDSEKYSLNDRWETTQIGRLIHKHTADFFPDLKFAELAIFNVPEYEGSSNNATFEDCRVRDAFYNLHKKKMPRVVDLGFLQLMPNRKETFSRLQLVCEFLIKR